MLIPAAATATATAVTTVRLLLSSPTGIGRWTYVQRRNRGILAFGSSSSGVPISSSTSISITSILVSVLTKGIVLFVVVVFRGAQVVDLSG